MVYGCEDSVLIYDLIAGEDHNTYESVSSSHIRQLAVSQDHSLAIMIDQTKIYSNKK